MVVGVKMKPDKAKRRVKPFGEALGNFIYNYSSVLTNEEMDALFWIAKRHKAFIMIVEEKKWSLEKDTLGKMEYFLLTKRRWKINKTKTKVKRK